MTAWLHDFPSEVREGSAGSGLFATRDLAANAAVARFEGELLAPSDVPVSEACHALVIDGETWMVPRTPARFVNHGCTPNCWVDDVTVRTLHPVVAGTELTFDYAIAGAAEYLADPAAFAWDPRWSFDCACGSALCRGRIDGYALLASAAELGPAVRVADVPGKGRAVFAARRIAEGERVDRAPVVVITAAQWPGIEGTALFDYTFEWGDDGQDAAMALGVGSLINHAYAPNVAFTRRYAEGVVDFVALRDIDAGEELTVNYNGDPADRSPVWFEVAE